MTWEIKPGPHSVDRMIEWGIPWEAVERIAIGGELIEDYPDDPRGHRQLVLGWLDGNPVHLVRSMHWKDHVIQVVTVYRPDHRKWRNNYKKRKRKR